MQNPHPALPAESHLSKLAFKSEGGRPATVDFGFWRTKANPKKETSALNRVCSIF
jgi:hypothetical protein